jgi:hypothetical protein
MHELLHIIGFCSDSATHISLLSVVATNPQTITDIKTLKNYVTKLKPSTRTTTNKR